MGVNHNKEPIAVKQVGLLGIYIYAVFQEGTEDYCIAGYSNDTPRKYKFYYADKKDDFYFKLKGQKHYLSEFLKLK